MNELWPDLWSEGDDPSRDAPTIRHVIWDPESGEPIGDGGGDADAVIHHRLADENGDPVKPEGTRE